jgi:phosphoglycolate phosphatase
MKAVIFDLDGTLLDSLADIAESINLMLDARGFPRCEVEAFRRMVGDGMERLVERALPPEQRTAEMIKNCTEEYRHFYDKHWAVETKPYEGIESVLDALRASGRKIGVISNKPHRFTVPMCDHFFGENRFDAVLGQRAEVPRKPAADAGLEMAAAFGLKPGECAYVGDSGVDMEFARAAGMKAIGVRWGFRTEEELVQAGAAVLIGHPEELLQHVH